MKYVYKQFCSDTEVKDFFTDIKKHIYVPIDNWYSQEGLILYGCFYDEEEKGAFYHYLFCFGQTIKADISQPLNDNTIFSKLKQYGSSSKYKGLRDVRGKIVLPNSFDRIELFYETETIVYFLIEKNFRKGIYEFQIDKIENIVPVQFEGFFDAKEYTWGYIKDGNVGFMSLNGKCITEAVYRDAPDFNHFTNGKALVCLSTPNGVNHFINHYGDCVGYPENEKSIKKDVHGLGTGYYPYGDLPDELEAFEGNELNFWNID